MNIALVLLAASALIGATAGLRLKAFALAPIGVLIAIVAAVVLRSQGFGFSGGIAIIFGCLLLSQVAYVLTLFLKPRSGASDRSLNDIPGGEPGRDREQTVDRDQGDQKPPPSGPLSPPEN